MQKKRTHLLKAGVATLAAFTLLFANPVTPNAASYADTLEEKFVRLEGDNRYETAIKVSQYGWTQTDTVVLARGDDYPDALAGAVLANSAKAQGPLLLTTPGKLSNGVLEEIQRLGAKKVYILGSDVAVSEDIEKLLTDEGLEVERLAGSDRYDTAAEIALEAKGESTQAYLASGSSFADALSISSYAAANGSPLLLTKSKELPEVTLAALKELGIKSVTLIGGPDVVTPAVQKLLEAEGISVDRLSGDDRYLTNLAVLNELDFNKKDIYVATGTKFPDALAGAVLAAKTNSPITLVPQTKLNSAALNYFDEKRENGSTFTLLGGWNVVSRSIENMIRTGSSDPRISLQYLQAYGASAYNDYLEQIAMIPDDATDYADYVAPHWYSLNLIPTGEKVANGSFTGPWSDLNNYKQIVQVAHARGLDVIPSLAAPWNEDGKKAVDTLLRSESSRQNLVANISKMLKDTGADGIAIDFEYLSDDSGPYLTQFMKELYTRLHDEQKLVIQAVPALTPKTTWYKEFEYQNLSKYVDYFNIMTYDYSNAAPGPIAPLNWVEDVLDYAASQNVDMEKVLMGVPYYGRDWKETEPGKYAKTSLGLNGANIRIEEFGATVKREKSEGDSVGIPTFTYTDSDGAKHIVYYEDVLSLGAKFELVDEYDLAGIGAWSLYWIIEESADDIYPVLKEHLR